MIDTTDINVLSETLNDIERLRIATENRFRSLEQANLVNTVEITLQITPTGVSHAAIKGTVEELNRLEQQVIKDLSKAIRTSPFTTWQKTQKGIGEKQAGRLLGALGDPYWNALHECPRTVNELWAYCGYAVDGASAVRRKKGEKANWSTEAKMRAYLMAESCVKSKGHYRAVYDETRAKYAEGVHTVDCVRCGPAGKPALAGSPLSAGHQHARALRKVAKEILKDLWIVARDHHEAVEQPVAA